MNMPRYGRKEPLQGGLRLGDASSWQIRRIRQSELTARIPKHNLFVRRRRAGWIRASFGPEDWPPLQIPSLAKKAYQRLIPAIQALAATLDALWTAQKRWVYQIWARAVVSFAVVMGLVTAATNAWGVPALNKKLPLIAHEVKSVLHRDVTIKQIHWLAPTGILGLHPLASLGPVVVGPGPTECSSGMIERVVLSLDPFRSILHGRLVINLKAHGADINLRQASNFSWFGFPDDTEPSARNFLPGLDNRENRRKPGKGGGCGGAGMSLEENDNHSEQESYHHSNHSRMGIPKFSKSNQDSSRSFPHCLPWQDVQRISKNSFFEGAKHKLMHWHSSQERMVQTSLISSLKEICFDERDKRSHADDEFRLLLMSVGRAGGEGDSTGGISVVDDFDSFSHQRQNKEKKQKSNGGKMAVLSEPESEETMIGNVSEDPEFKTRTQKQLEKISSFFGEMDLNQRTLLTNLVGHKIDGTIRNSTACPLNDINHHDDRHIVSEMGAHGTPDKSELFQDKGMGYGLQNHEKPKLRPTKNHPRHSNEAFGTLHSKRKRCIETINSIPALEINLNQGSKSEENGQIQEAATQASQRINSLGSLERRENRISIPSSDPRMKIFSDIVIDRGYEKRKAVGSKALQQARNWKPARPVLGIPKLSTADVALPDNGKDLALKSNSIPKSYTANSTEINNDSYNEGSTRFQSLQPIDSHQQTGRYHITHPGYFPQHSGPVYTPAPPEAIKRMKDRGLVSALGKMLNALVAQVQGQIVLGEIKFHNAVISAHINGEEKPRIFEDASACLSLGRNYDSILFNISAKPLERDPSSNKLTMPNPNSHRHLRDFISLKELAQLEEKDDQALLLDDFPVADDEKKQELVKKKACGGKIDVHLEVKDILDNELGTGGSRVPKLSLSIRAEHLHAPLIERIVELPMDINAGQADGEIIIKSDDVQSWKFPKFYGKVQVRNSHFHFWDATDDIFDADLDLVFDCDKLFIHRAKGRFGAVPMTLSGDLDLNPLTGSYRLSASVPSVEINALRATLGIRPTPFAVAGGVKGTLFVSGPIEKPVFSGRAIATRPSDKLLNICEPSDAVDSIKKSANAVAAYDRVAFAGVEVMFSLDTSSNTMSLYSIQASPLSGGNIHGYGKMDVSPKGEMDPNALNIHTSGSGLQPSSLVKPYMIGDASLPESLVDGPASFHATMSGAGLSPIIDVTFALPATSASVTARLTRRETSLSFKSPNLDAKGSIFVQPYSFDEIKAALTQEQASALAKPKIIGCNSEFQFKGLDVVPLATKEAALRKITQQSGESLRLRLNGRAKVAGNVKYLREESTSPIARTIADAERDTSLWKLVGKIDLDDFKLNQLKLYHALRGTFDVSEMKASFHGKGLRPDESLDITLSLPWISSQAKHQPKFDGKKGVIESLKMDETKDTIGAAGTSISLRSGPLFASACIDDAGSAMDVRVTNLKLDELELASLRGDLQEISCSLNFLTQTGRGRLNLLTPRFSGLGGESLTGGFRWEKDVVRLERLALQQKNSRYEVQGEYVIPSLNLIPHSTADLRWPGIENENAGNDIDNSGSSTFGRWRLRVDVPMADMQEILPAARLLQSAASRAPADYGRAKMAFIQALQNVNLAANSVGSELISLVDSLPGTNGRMKENDGSYSKGAVAPSSLNANNAFHFPGLQDFRGIWNGSIQAFGGGGGATSCEFDIRGHGWGWEYSVGLLDAIVAKGNYHSEEGVQLQEFVLKSGDAKFLVRGSILSEHQDANILLTDFPLATLRPLYKAIPALRNIAPQTTGPGHGSISSSLASNFLANTVSRVTDNIEDDAGAESPIAGMLYVSGSVGGSKEKPNGELMIKVYDASIGSTKLSQAQASARVSDDMLMAFNVDMIPIEGHRKTGHVRASGSIPLASLDSSQDSMLGEKRSDGKAGQHQDRHLVDGSSDPSSLDVRLSVRDGGMSVLTSLTPEVSWESGQADITLKVTGTLESPIVSGTTSIGKALLDCKFLKYPLEVVSVDMKCDDGILQISSLDFRCGRRGHLRARGILPLNPQQPASGTAEALQKLHNRITIDINGIELRVRNAYSGQLDALLTMRNSILRPIVGGSMRFSRGSIYLIPQGQDISGASQVSGSLPNESSVAKVFGLLTQGKDEFSTHLGDAIRQEVQTMEGIMGEAAGANVTFDSLALHFGPELRAVYPLVMNFAVSGELNLFGPATPKGVGVEGVLKLLGGDINLVAAQLELDREHVNTLVFSGEPGISAIDPVVDVVLASGDVKVAVLGKASEWAEHLSMRSTAGTSASGDGGEQLDATEAARLLEAKLKAALLAEDGQLALNRLAGTTVSTLLPKIETQGTVGGTRWRLVSAPAIPGLLDPFNTDPSNFLGSIAMGTEAEVQFGKRLQAAMTRKLRESNVTTCWTLNYNLSSKLRMQFSISSASPYDKTLTIQYNSSEGGK